MTDVNQTNSMWPGNGKSNNLMSWPVANKQELDIKSHSYNHRDITALLWAQRTSLMQYYRYFPAVLFIQHFCRNLFFELCGQLFPNSNKYLEVLLYSLIILLASHFIELVTSYNNVIQVRKTQTGKTKREQIQTLN